MSQFPFSLPPEVVCKIFSHLDQDDCMECMRVCHQWYSEIPDYATELWEQIAIATGYMKTNDCMLRCLGPHTQDVVIDDVDSTASVLKKLKEKKCTIKTLDCNIISVKDNRELFSTIGLFKDTLATLCLYRCKTEVSVCNLLSQFPNLTHLQLEFHYDLRPHLGKPIESSLWSERCLSNLTYLHLDAYLHFDDRLIPALRCCPKLKNFTTSPTMAAKLPTDALYRIFQLCPDISFFEWNKVSCPRAEYYHDESDPTFHTFGYRGNIDVLQKFKPVLAKAENTLQHLTICNESHDSIAVSDMLTQLRFPRAKHLGLVDVRMTPVEWISSLSSFQDIESFNLLLVRIDLAMNRMAEIISCWKNLRNLDLDLSDDSAANLMDAWDNVGILSKNSQLQSVSLQYIHISNRGLLDLCDIPSLKNLCICIPRNSDISLDGLLEFADKLKARNIQDLELRYFTNLDDSVLERLGNIESLSRFSLSHNDRITTLGLKALLCKNTRGNVARTADVTNCKHIDKTLWNQKSFS